MDRPGPPDSVDPSPTYHPAGAVAAAGENSNSITGLISGILEDSTTLIKQQLVMLQAEVKEDLQRSVTAGKYLGVGVFLVLMGLFFVLMGLPLLLNAVSGLDLWLCWFIIGAVLLVFGGIALVLGRSALAKFSAVPHKTLNALSENLSWVAKPQK